MRSGARSSASPAWVPRVTEAPHTSTTGGPEPSRSNPIVVPSPEVTVSIRGPPCRRVRDGRRYDGSERTGRGTFGFRSYPVGGDDRGDDHRSNPHTWQRRPPAVSMRATGSTEEDCTMGANEGSTRAERWANQLRRLRLRFDDAFLESAFRADQFRHNLGNIRFAFLAG